MDALFPPGPRKNLLLGNSIEFRHDPFTAMLDAARSYGEIVHFRFGPSHAYLVTSADHIHYVLVERPDLFDTQHHFYRAIQSAFGHELFAPDEGVYKRQRTSQPLPQNWFEEHTATVVNDALEAVAGWQSGQVIDLYQTLRELTLQIAAKTVFGCEVNNAIRQLAVNAPQSHALRDRRFTSPWALRLPVGDQTLATVIKLIRQQTSIKGNHALALLGQTSLSEQQIAETLIRLFVLVHETAATTLSWALYLLSRHPESAETLHCELNTVSEDAELTYTEMVLRETMRLYPPAWLVTRQSRREARLGSFFVPAGSTILCSPYIMHHDPRNFVEPEKFMPERFIEGYEKRIRRYAFAPFGVSAPVEQATLMTEMKLLLTTLARRFHFVHEGNHPEVLPQVSLCPKNGLPMRVEKIAT